MPALFKLYISVLSLVWMPWFNPVQANDIEIIKKRVVDELMKTPIEDQKVTDILHIMAADGSFMDIDYGDLSRNAGFPHRRHTSDLVYLAKAYKSKHSTYYGSQSLKERIITSLEYWVIHDFFGDNWHDNQITTPTNLVNLMLVFGDEIPQELILRAQPIIGRAHMGASGARPSGDRIVIAGILAKNLLFLDDAAGFDPIIALIADEVKFSTGERGIQHDFSFHHREDRVNNTVSYGYGKYANAFGEWSYYVADTRYAFPLENINLLVDYYLDGIYKQLVYGVYQDVSVKNRSITQEAVFQPQGVVEIERLLISTDYRKEELEEIIRLRKGEASPSRSFSKFFWQTEHFVFQRPGFYTTVRMFSTRNRNMEMPYNGPGKPTHHRADGTNYLMLKGDEYHNIWPVYDWQKISGTTIMQKPKLHGIDSIQLEGLTDFVGAVTDGLYGAVAFDFKSPHDLLEAKKSWFFFDQEYVCLGTDIKSPSDLPLATTVNQVLMRSEVSVEQDGLFKKLPPGSRRLDHINWVYQDRIGYIFPEPATVHLSNQEEKGRWSDITDQKNISQNIVSLQVFKLWFDHGNTPDKASYQYIVVPNVSEEEMRTTRGNNRDIDIIANSADIQAVNHRGLGICQFAFYRAGEIEIAPGTRVAMDSHGMAMLKLEGERVGELTVSDPSRKLNQLIVTISGIYEGQGDDFITYPNREKGSTRILVDLPQGVYAGKSITLKLQ